MDNQKKLLIETMEADEKDGLYKTNSMKLYTEEQLHNTVIAISNYLDDINLGRAQENIEKHLKALQPIELPSDEEIEKNFTIGVAPQTSYPHMIEGAKWMKKQILNQNK